MNDEWEIREFNGKQVWRRKTDPPDFMKSIGLRYSLKNFGGDEHYILAQSEALRVCLISLRTGNRWEEPVAVADPRNLTNSEWAQVTRLMTFRPMKEE